jgi:predicted RNA-binding protein YlxR (DUF448 family)
VVRTAEGRVEVDETGKKPGRGAYLCRARDCWDAALKRKALEYALKVPATVEDRQALQAFAASLPYRTKEEQEQEIGQSGIANQESAQEVS